jgi:hypothetical protein
MKARYRATVTGFGFHYSERFTLAYLAHRWARSTNCINYYLTRISDGKVVSAYRRERLNRKDMWVEDRR